MDGKLGGLGLLAAGAAVVGAIGLVIYRGLKAKGMISLGGLVTDANSGAPLPGVTIQLGQQETVTDEGGEYTLDITPGVYDLRVSLAGYLNRQYADLHLEGNTRLDLQLTLDDGTSGATVFGTVLDGTSGGPISGATVVVGIETTVTDNYGAYILSSLTPGDYQIFCAVSGYNEFVREQVPLTAGENQFNIVLQAGQPTATLSGSVIDGGSGDSIRGALVMLGEENYLAVTDSEGQYRIESILPGIYDVAFSHSAYNRVVYEALPVEGGTVLDMALQPIPAIEGLVVVDFPCDEGEGITLRDYSGFGNNATVGGLDPEWDTLGFVSGSQKGHARATYAPIMACPRGVCIEADIYPFEFNPRGQSQQFIVSRYYRHPYALLLEGNRFGLAITLSDGTYHYAFSPAATVDLNQFQRVRVEYDCEDGHVIWRKNEIIVAEDFLSESAGISLELTTRSIDLGHCGETFPTGEGIRPFEGNFRGIRVIELHPQ